MFLSHCCYLKTLFGIFRLYKLSDVKISKKGKCMKYLKIIGFCCFSLSITSIDEVEPVKITTVSTSQKTSSMVPYGYYSVLNSQMANLESTEASRNNINPNMYEQNKTAAPAQTKVTTIQPKPINSTILIDQTIQDQTHQQAQIAKQIDETTTLIKNIQNDVHQKRLQLESLQENRKSWFYNRKNEAQESDLKQSISQLQVQLDGNQDNLDALFDNQKAVAMNNPAKNVLSDVVSPSKNASQSTVNTAVQSSTTLGL